MSAFNRPEEEKRKQILHYPHTNIYKRPFNLLQCNEQILVLIHKSKNIIQWKEEVTLMIIKFPSPFSLIVSVVVGFIVMVFIIVFFTVIAVIVITSIKSLHSTPFRIPVLRQINWKKTKPPQPTWIFFNILPHIFFLIIVNKFKE